MKENKLGSVCTLPPSVAKVGCLDKQQRGYSSYFQLLEVHKVFHYFKHT